MNCRSSSVPTGKLLRNPSEVQLARCIGLVKPIDAQTIYDVVIVGAGPAGSPPRFTRPPRACRYWCWIAARSAAKPVRRRGSRIISASRLASAAWR